MRKPLISAGIALALSAGAAGAEGWTIADLGSMEDRDECMRMAEATVDAYRMAYGGDGFTGRSEWTIGGGCRCPVHLSDRGRAGRALPYRLQLRQRQ